MGIFGWDLPPGAAGDPFAPWNRVDEPLQITDWVKGLPDDLDLFWTEDGALIVQTCLLDCYPKQVTVGKIEWDDAISDDANCKAAAELAWRLYRDRFL